MSSKSVFVLLASVALSACVSTTPQWDSQFGQAVRGAIASQTIDPAAAANPDPVAGLDGKAALGAQQRYERTFAQPPTAASALFHDAAGK